MNENPTNRPPKTDLPGPDTWPLPKERAQGVPTDEDLNRIRDEKERDKGADDE